MAKDIDSLVEKNCEGVGEEKKKEFKEIFKKWLFGELLK